jgi:flagellar assembly protein FliH
MSSSEHGGTPPPGRIIMGMQSERLSDGCRVVVWTEEREAELMARVRAKAREQARQILSQAMEEAERVKGRIREEVHSECMAELRREIQQSQDALCERAGTLLTAISREQHKICMEHRKELVELLKIAVEKAVRNEVVENGERYLGALLEEGLELLDAHRELTVTVRPQDVPAVEDLLGRAKAKFPSLERWRVKSSASMESGGLILETGFGLVDNSTATRLESIRAIMDQLSLGEDRE